jgi:hypothetical protein
MNDILADRVLRDLIEQLETAFHSLDAVLFEPPTPDEFRDLSIGAADTLRAAVAYLLALREDRLRRLEQRHGG